MSRLLLRIGIAFFCIAGPLAQSAGSQLRDAVFGGDDTLVRKLAVNKVAVNATSSEGVTPLMIASALGRSAALKVLLTSGADVGTATKSGVTALMFATCFGQLEAAQALVDRGAKIETTAMLGYRAIDFSLAQCEGRGERSQELSARKVAVAKYLTSKGAAAKNLTGDDILFFLTTHNLKTVLDKAQAER